MDTLERFTEKFAEPNFAGQLFIKRNTRAIDIFNWFNDESNLVETPVSPTEPTFTQKQILDLVRKELTEAFSDDYTPDELKDKIYLVHGYIIGALRR